jgi:hypothetical protein
MCGCADGPYPPKTMDGYMNVIIDQLIDIYQNGVEVIDASDDDKNILIRGMVLYTMCDYPVHALLTHQQKSGENACMKCFVKVSSLCIAYV